jgi:cytoskeletal protein RodZ
MDLNEEILKKLEQKVGRRSFLRGSGLAAIAIVGVAASPLMAYAQQQTQDEKKKTEDEKKAEEDKAAEKKGEAKKPASDDKNETKLDAEGREYRECPQCGSNMYRQGRTWTCENCGYSYVE